MVFMFGPDVPLENRKKKEENKLTYAEHQILKREGLLIL